MEIVFFHKKTWKEIPRQDNPAFMTKKEWEDQGINGCLVICKSENYRVNGAIIDVIRITPVENPLREDSVTTIGSFWLLEYAELFAKSVVSQT